MSNKVLHSFALVLVFSVFCLIISGGLVTSYGVGLSVPDWPNTYGYNMFLFPVSGWIGGIFYEHTHRLLASTVGFLTLILAVALWMSDNRTWLKWLGLVAVFAVILQGVLGGLRVTLIKDWIGIFHACLAQSFLLLCAFIALATSKWWKEARLTGDPAGNQARTLLFFSCIIFCQLAIAATMRHAHAGLSIPDFPTAYGHFVPPMDASSLEKINAHRLAGRQPETTAALIALQFTHRLLAYFLGLAIPWFTFRMIRLGGVLKLWSMVWSGLVLTQIVLGAWTIWSNKAADVATAHVAVGASLFVLGGLMTIVAFRARRESAAMVPLTAKTPFEKTPVPAEFAR